MLPISMVEDYVGKARQIQRTREERIRAETERIKIAQEEGERSAKEIEKRRQEKEVVDRVAISRATSFLKPIHQEYIHVAQAVNETNLTDVVYELDRSLRGKHTFYKDSSGSSKNKVYMDVTDREIERVASDTMVSFIVFVNGLIKSNKWTKKYLRQDPEGFVGEMDAVEESWETLDLEDFELVYHFSTSDVNTVKLKVQYLHRTVQRRIEFNENREDVLRGIRRIHQDDVAYFETYTRQLANDEMNTRSMQGNIDGLLNTVIADSYFRLNVNTSPFPGSEERKRLLQEQGWDFAREEDNRPSPRLSLLERLSDWWYSR